MAQARVITDVQAVLGGANLDIQPAAGQVYEVTAVGSSVAFVGVPPAALPDVSVGLYNGAIGPAHFIRSTDLRGQYRPQKWILDNGNYLRITNDAVGAANISVSGRIYQDFGLSTANNVCMSDVQALGAGVTYTLQPAAGDDYIVHDIGSDTWVGAAPAGLPNVRADLTDGVLTAILLQGTDARKWEPNLQILISNGNYLNLVNTAGAGAVIGFSAELFSRSGAAGTTKTRTDLLAVGAGAAVDFTPATGEEWEVTETGASVWVGVPPLAFPDISVQVWDTAAAIGGIVQNNANWLNNGHKTSIHIDNGHPLRITDTGGAGLTAGICALLTQSFAV